MMVALLPFVFPEGVQKRATTDPASVCLCKTLPRDFYSIGLRTSLEVPACLACSIPWASFQLVFTMLTPPTIPIGVKYCWWRKCKDAGF